VATTHATKSHAAPLKWAHSFAAPALNSHALAAITACWRSRIARRSREQHTFRAAPERILCERRIDAQRAHLTPSGVQPFR
jgi:hypothetical protein